MAQNKNDELNIIGNKNSSDVFDREEFINHYFDVMQITEKQKKERIEAAEEIFDAILLFLIWCENAPERVQEEDTLSSFENMYKEVIFQYGEPDEYFDNYVHSFIPLLIHTTLEHVGEEYFTSVERAANVACNEANSVVNHTELQQAIEDGYSYKRWCTELDVRVRPTHQVMEGITIPINEPFQVGQYLMMQPHDITLGAGAEEIVNCRCCLVFLDYPEENATIELPDIQIFKTLSAATQNYDVYDFDTDEYYRLVEGTRLQDVEVFAGKGVSTPYRRAYKYADKFGNEPEEWQHVKGKGLLDTPDGQRLAEVHWSQCKEYGKHDFFVKKWLD